MLSNSQICSDALLEKSPLVSVGIPTFNRPDGLRRTLECITGQTYKNLEIIVSDNCSPGPETESVVREFMAKDSRIRYYRQEINRGPTVNFGFVLEKATGEYFMWAADDDEWESPFIYRLLDLMLKRPDISGAMSGVKIIDDHGKIVKTIRYPLISKPDYSRFRLAFFASSHDEIAILIYGLYLTEKANLFYKNSDNTFGKDMLMVCDMVLSVKFGYVDEILHIRQVHLKGTAELYKEEEIGKNYGDPFNYLKFLFRFGLYLLRSPNIPLKRKFWIPFMSIRQGIWVGKIYINRIFNVFVVTARKKSQLDKLLTHLSKKLKYRK